MESNLSIRPKTDNQKSGKSRRGFASMDKQRHKEVSSKGGQSPRVKLASEPVQAIQSTYERL
jgi:general stress protein YciG